MPEQATVVMLAILWKDLRIEWRTKEMLTSFGILAVLLVLTLSFAHEAVAGPEHSGRVAGALWVAFMFAGMLGIQRSLLLERENECVSGLLLSPVDAGEIFLAKLLANVAMLALMQLLILPLAVVFMGADVGGHLGALVLVMGLGNLGFAAIATFFAGVAARTRSREVMLPLLILPLLLPLVILAVKATGAVLEGGGVSDVGPTLTYLVAFDVMYCTAGWLLFEYVVRE
jgi:heme exporter protein B